MYKVPNVIFYINFILYPSNRRFANIYLFNCQVCNENDKSVMVPL